MANPFIIEPSSTEIVQENATKRFVWEIEGCGWEVRIITEKYTLYPNIDPTQVPIKVDTDYNVSVTPDSYSCKESTVNTSVSLSITFSLNVMEYFNYFTCKVFRNNEKMYRSRVNLEIAPPSVETMITEMMSEATSTTDSEITNTEKMLTAETLTVMLKSVTVQSMPFDEMNTVATDSGHRQSLHLLFCLIQCIIELLFMSV